MNKILLTLFFPGLILVNTAYADRDDDSKEVYQLLQKGEVISLEQLLAQNRDKLQGRVLDLEMEREKERIIYEIKTIDAAGVVREVKIDARTGEWIGEKIKRSKPD